MYAHRSRSTKALLILGQTTWRKQHQRFGLLPEDRLRHLWVLGKTGSGKSTLLANLLAQDLASGMGLALLDPHGGLVAQALAHVPRARINDVLLLCPADAAFPVSFNVFRAGRRPHDNPALFASQLVSVFKKHWADFWGPRLEHVLRNAILAVATDQRATLVLLYRFLTDETLRQSVVRRVADPAVRAFWQREFPGYSRQLQAEAVSPVLNKLGAFVSHPVVRAIVGQVRSRIDLIEIMDRRGVLLADLRTGAIGEDASHLLGGLLLSALQLAAMARGRSCPPLIIYADEFQHFVSDSLATLLSESRKFGVGLVLAHQYLAQLPPRLADAVLGNVGSMVVFGVGAADAAALAPELAPVFTPEDLSAPARFEMAVRLTARGQSLAPFSARALPPRQPAQDAARIAEIVRAQSRARYARPRREVDAAIAEQLGV